jgi:hypothetical protein
MCGTCHVKTDSRFPSALVYEFTPENCLDCHGKLENPDVSWVEDVEKTVKLGHMSLPSGGAFLGKALVAEMAETLEGAGARFVWEGPDLIVDIDVRLRRVAEERFVPKGYAVCVARIGLTLRRPGEGVHLLSREAYSRPEYSPTEKGAAELAVADVWRVMEPFFLEAVGSY